jgi:hypothetical protein
VIRPDGWEGVIKTDTYAVKRYKVHHGLGVTDTPSRTIIPDLNISQRPLSVSSQSERLVATANCKSTCARIVVMTALADILFGLRSVR